MSFFVENMNQVNKVLIALALLLGSLAAYAVPAYPGLVNAIQPDGTVVAIRLHGDESLNWASTPDGYTLLRNSEGYWSFARRMNDGSIQPSELTYTGDVSVAEVSNIEKGLMFSATQQKHLPTNSLFRCLDTKRYYKSILFQQE